ncbi:hypothetical protein [Paenibacillus sp. MMS18-CY102]|uniref:hypothetical protein n=1 Tax=Paenibacillus sp. MMS18-CY102 TaxID=2682849 RepID=UPI00136628B2|nr:hypothetical protein [Paenibacillus sp. MMS18-CY102]MWC30518.1 hypothetical protein [Paenibacillus sp. MMS18-CY102]
MKHLVKLGAVAVLIVMAIGCQNAKENNSGLNKSTAAEQSISPENKATSAGISAEAVGEQEKQEQKDVQPDPLLNAIHKDSFELNGDNYEIGYWNDGEFDFTRFVILKNGIVAFDSREEQIAFEGGYFNEEGLKGAQVIKQHGRPAFFFDLADNRPESSCLVIEEMDGHMEVTVHDNVMVMADEESNKGEANLNLTVFPFYGQMPLGPSLVTIYTWESDHYEPNLDLTRRYWEEELARSEQAFLSAPDEMKLDTLLSAYLALGRQDEAKQWLASYEKDAEKSAENAYLADYERYLSDAAQGESIYADWMEKVQPLAR